jgi:DNA-binding NarL/FixJ family response regulator
MSTATQRRVVIVNDSRTVQAMLDHAFSKRDDFRVVGIASDAASGAEMIRQLRPDVVTIDLCMPYLDGAALLEMLSDLPTVCKIVVSDNAISNIRLTSELREVGASACLAKSSLVNDAAGFFKKISAAINAGVKSNPHHLSSIGLPEAISSAAARDLHDKPIVGFPVPTDERERLAFLQRNHLANANRERPFDIITKHVAKVTAFPACLITIIDRETQWIKSAYGLEAESTPRDQAFCNYTISQGGVFTVSNATADERFANNPLVTGSPNIKSYAGHPVINRDGVTIATLCVIDVRPRTVSSHVIDQLAGMSELVGEMIEERVAQAA